MGAIIPDNDLLVQAGINPRTKLPYKNDSSGDKSELKSEIKKTLRILDEQNAINRFKWYNLPSGLDGQLLERILYYKGQGAFFYMETDNQFYFLPYALSGSIDVYGRFRGITALPFNGTSQDSEEKAWITGLIKKPIYGIKLPEELKLEDFTDGCVLLSDYSKQISQTNISRQILQDPILDTMSEMFPFMRTSLLNSTGIKGMRVNDEDQQSNVKAASRSITRAALTGDPWIPLVGQIDFQELNSGAITRAQEYLLAMQSLDNYRLSLYGLDNGGLFQKKSHMLEAEQEMNQGNVGLVLQDSLTLRQRFCDTVNSIWGTSIWCEVSETIIGVDKNLDGEVSDTIDQSGSNPGDQPSGGTDDM